VSFYFFTYAFALRLAYRSKDVKSRKDVPFGGYKTNLILNPIYPKTIKMWPEHGEFFRPKTLNNGNAHI